MCYGVKPSEISFASHSRVCNDLYESTARIRNGGDALIMGFADRFRTLGVDILCGRHIVECGPLADDRVTSFILDNGEEVAADSAVLTLHPQDILGLLPASSVSKALRARVSAFEPSAGFFTAYGVLDGGAAAPDFGSTIVSLFPLSDFDRMLDPAYADEPALVIVGSLEQAHGRTCQAVTTFEPSQAEHVAPWSASFHGRRPAGYDDYKVRRTEAILDHLGRYEPFYRDRLRILDTASQLTFRDYLCSPHGSAYGIKQKVGQFNLIGRLPVRNLFAAGQSSLLPGLTGAMMSSFIVTRSVIGRDDFNKFIHQRL